MQFNIQDFLKAANVSGQSQLLIQQMCVMQGKGRYEEVFLGIQPQ